MVIPHFSWIMMSPVVISRTLWLIWNFIFNEIDAAFFKTSDYFTRFNLHFSWVHKRIGITNLVPYGKMKIELLLPCA